MLKVCPIEIIKNSEIISGQILNSTISLLFYSMSCVGVNIQPKGYVYK